MKEYAAKLASETSDRPRPERRGQTKAVVIMPTSFANEW